MKKQNKNLFLFALLFAFITLVLISLVLILPYKENPAKNISLSDNYVTRVIDGDTFVINSGKTIRLLCVNTPEKNQKGYEDAKKFLEFLILDREVILNKSVTDKDAYGRELRYVYANDSFINKVMLNKGYGELLIIPPETCREVLN